MAATAVILGGGAVGGLLAASASTNTVSATTTITGRDDSGYAKQTNNTYDWATDAMTRTGTVTYVGVHSGPECGTGWAACYEFTGSVADTNGTFTTDPGAVSPNAGAVIQNGPVTGSFTGGATGFTFYADSNNVSAANVPATVNGDGPVDTSNWLSLIFPAHTKFSSATDINNVNGTALLPTWSWTYTGDCGDQWVDAYNVTRANSGDITGNHCLIKSTDLTENGIPLVVDDPHVSTVNGTLQQVWQQGGVTGSNGNPVSQGWLVKTLPDGNVKIELAKNPAYCLDVRNYGVTNGTKVQLWACNGGVDQEWLPRNGVLSAVHASTVQNHAMVLDDPNGNGNGNVLQIWQQGGVTGSSGVLNNQLWSVPAAA